MEYVGVGAALHMASANGHLDVVKYLIEHGAVSTFHLSEVMNLCRSGSE